MLENFFLTDADWDALGIPIGLAFFQRTTGGRILAFYPGPAGPTESLLDLNAWSQLVANNPVLAEQQADVEALLVNCINGAREYYQIPIDHCYALVRAHPYALARRVRRRPSLEGNRRFHEQSP